MLRSDEPSTMPRSWQEIYNQCKVVKDNDFFERAQTLRRFLPWVFVKSDEPAQVWEEYKWIPYTDAIHKQISESYKCFVEHLKHNQLLSFVKSQLYLEALCGCSTRLLTTTPSSPVLVSIRLLNAHSWHHTKSLSEKH